MSFFKIFCHTLLTCSIALNISCLATTSDLVNQVSQQEEMKIDDSFLHVHSTENVYLSPSSGLKEKDVELSDNIPFSDNNSDIIVLNNDLERKTDSDDEEPNEVYAKKILEQKKRPTLTGFSIDIVGKQEKKKTEERGKKKAFKISKKQEKRELLMKKIKQLDKSYQERGGRLVLADVQGIPSKEVSKIVLALIGRAVYNNNLQLNSQKDPLQHFVIANQALNLWAEMGTMDQRLEHAVLFMIGAKIKEIKEDKKKKKEKKKKKPDNKTTEPKNWKDRKYFLADIVQKESQYTHLKGLMKKALANTKDEEKIKPIIGHLQEQDYTDCSLFLKELLSVQFAKDKKGKYDECYNFEQLYELLVRQKYFKKVKKERQVKFIKRVMKVSKAQKMLSYYRFIQGISVQIESDKQLKELFDDYILKPKNAVMFGFLWLMLNGKLKVYQEQKELLDMQEKKEYNMEPGPDKLKNLVNTYLGLNKEKKRPTDLIRNLLPFSHPITLYFIQQLIQEEGWKEGLKEKDLKNFFFGSQKSKVLIIDEAQLEFLSVLFAYNLPINEKYAISKEEYIELSLASLEEKITPLLQENAIVDQLMSYKANLNKENENEENEKRNFNGVITSILDVISQHASWNMPYSSKEYKESKQMPFGMTQLLYENQEKDKPKVANNKVTDRKVVMLFRLLTTLWASKGKAWSRNIPPIHPNAYAQIIKALLRVDELSSRKLLNLLLGVAVEHQRYADVCTVECLLLDASSPDQDTLDQMKLVQWKKLLDLDKRNLPKLLARLDSSVISRLVEGKFKGFQLKRHQVEVIVEKLARFYHLNALYAEDLLGVGDEGHEVSYFPERVTWLLEELKLKPKNKEKEENEDNNKENIGEQGQKKNQDQYIVSEPPFVAVLQNFRAEGKTQTQIKGYTLDLLLKEGGDALLLFGALVDYWAGSDIGLTDLWKRNGIEEKAIKNLSEIYPSCISYFGHAKRMLFAQTLFEKTDVTNANQRKAAYNLLDVLYQNNNTPPLLKEDQFDEKFNEQEDVPCLTNNLVSNFTSFLDEQKEISGLLIEFWLEGEVLEDDPWRIQIAKSLKSKEIQNQKAFLKALMEASKVILGDDTDDKLFFEQLGNTLNQKGGQARRVREELLELGSHKEYKDFFAKLNQSKVFEGFSLEDLLLQRDSYINENNLDNARIDEEKLSRLLTLYQSEEEEDTTLIVPSLMAQWEPSKKEKKQFVLKVHEENDQNRFQGIVGLLLMGKEKHIALLERLLNQQGQEVPFLLNKTLIEDNEGKVIAPKANALLAIFSKHEKLADRITDLTPTTSKGCVYRKVRLQCLRVDSTEKLYHPLKLLLEKKGWAIDTETKTRERSPSSEKMKQEEDSTTTHGHGLNGLLSSSYQGHNGNLFGNGYHNKTTELGDSSSPREYERNSLLEDNDMSSVDKIASGEDGDKGGASWWIHPYIVGITVVGLIVGVIYIVVKQYFTKIPAF